MSNSKSEKAHKQSEKLSEHHQKLVTLAKKTGLTFGRLSAAHEGHSRYSKLRKSTKGHHVIASKRAHDVMVSAAELKKIASVLMEMAEKLERESEVTVRVHNEAAKHCEQLEMFNATTQKR